MILKNNSFKVLSLIVIFLVMSKNIYASSYTKINNELYKSLIYPILNSIDIRDSSNLYHSQIKLMLPVLYYNYSTLDMQNKMVDKFTNILESLPSLNALRNKAKKGIVKMDAFYLNINKSGKMDRKIYPISKKDGTIYYDGCLSLLQFNYLISQLAKEIVIKSKYSALSENEKHFIEISVKYLNNDLIIPLYRYIESWWYKEAGGAYKNMQDRIRDKLNNRDSKRLNIKTYYSAFIDEEFFLMAIASDLMFIHNNYGMKFNTDVIKNILLDTNNMMTQRLKPKGFLFDIGKWTDHPSFEYAAYTGLVYPNHKYRKLDVALDTSHSYRWPLWLRSYRDAYPYGSELYNKFNNLIYRFSNQLKNVIKYTKYGPYLTNYIDGNNGWYRVKQSWGYGPFTLSTMAQYGSFYLLPGDHIDKFIKSMSDMINSNNKSVIAFRTAYYGEYNYSKTINERGLRSIDLMGKSTLASLYIELIKSMRSNNDNNN
jgi:hypothetical protein